MSSAAPTYRADIDGLRAVAVGLVLGYHFFPNHVKSGFIGVDVFFVISGYLISSIIMGQMERGSWSYLHFYTRRINRIFPALVLLLAFNALLGWYALVPNEFTALGKHIAASAAFVANFALWSEAGYFDLAADTKPLLHLWSLAIEEQFYILWPLILAFGVRRRFLPIVSVLAFASLAYSIWASNYSVTAAYYSPVSRFFELAAGGILAYAHRHGFRLEGRAAHLMSVAGAALIAAGIFLITKNSPFPGLYALFPTLGTAAFIAAGSGALINRRLLAFAPMVWIGLISYPLYLWHWSLLVWAKTLRMSDGLDAKTRLGLVALSVVLAAITYVFVEKPIRNRNTGRLAIILASITAVIGITGLLFWAGVVTSRLNDKSLEPIVAAVNDWEYPAKGMTVQATFADYTFYRKAGRSSDMVLFVGDSNAEQYAPRIATLIDRSASGPGAIFATKGGCPFASPVMAARRRDCAGKLKEIRGLIASKNVKAVAIVQQWVNLPELVDDRRIAESFRELLRSIPVGTRKYVILNIPTGAGYGPTDLLRGSRLHQLDYRAAEYRNGADSRAAIGPLNARIREIAEKEGAVVIDPFDTLCKGDACRVTTPDGRPIYKDRGHLAASFVHAHATYVDRILSDGRQVVRAVSGR